jgi:hypothetical protein
MKGWLIKIKGGSIHILPVTNKQKLTTSITIIRKFAKFLTVFELNTTKKLQGEHTYYDDSETSH